MKNPEEDIQICLLSNLHPCKVVYYSTRCACSNSSILQFDSFMYEICIYYVDNIEII